MDIVLTMIFFVKDFNLLGKKIQLKKKLLISIPNPISFGKYLQFTAQYEMYATCATCDYLLTLKC